MTTAAPRPAPIGEEAAFHAHVDRAKTLPEAVVKTRGDAQLALDNVIAGLDAILAARAELDTKWPKARVDALGEARSLALAAAFASSRARQLDVSESEVATLVSVAYDLRDKALSVAEMCSKFGLLPADRVEKLREGRGSLDAGQDLVDAVALFREFDAALVNRTPLTPEFLAQAEKAGNDVVLAVRTTGARRRDNPEAKEAADLANRFWTLLVDAHRELRKAGFELWADGVDSRVPLLQSRTVSRKAPAPAPAPA